MSDTQGDPVLEQQSQNRKTLDKVLGKYGWKLGKVGLRAGGTVVTYELVRLSDNRKVEEGVPLTEILMWSLNAEADPHTQAMHDSFPDLGSVLLGIRLLARVKQENGNV
jgi:hypothetical protein